MQHACPYCSYPITRENVLFLYNLRKTRYLDKRRVAFYNLCASGWPLENDGQFDGLYYLPSDAEDDTVMYNKNDFPVCIRVKPCNGKTPSELEQMEIPGTPLTDFIAQYGDETPFAAETTPNPIDVAASVYNTPSAPGHKAETEYKPVDDGNTILLATRACPNCHNELHQRFGEIQTITVTLLGGPSAGKTAYLLSLVHQLSSQLSDRRLGTAELLKASQEYYNHLNSGYQTEKSTMPTVRDDRLFPFIFYYSNQWQKECFVKFCDIAGESTKDTNSLLNHSGTMEATTLLVILDPNQLNSGMYAAFTHSNLAEYSTSSNVLSFNDSIPSYLTKTISLNQRLGAFSKVNQIITVFSKMDMVLTMHRKDFGAGATNAACLVRFDLGRAHYEALDVPVIEHVANDLEHFINKALRMTNFSLRRYMCSFFPADRDIQSLLLGVSTYTLTNEKDIVFENLCQEDAHKHRIIEPFLCILAKNGMIPVRPCAQSDDNTNNKNKKRRGKN